MLVPLSVLTAEPSCFDLPAELFAETDEISREGQVLGCKQHGYKEISARVVTGNPALTPDITPTSTYRLWDATIGGMYNMQKSGLSGTACNPTLYLHDYEEFVLEAFLSLA
jgi:hypothetical protein